MRITNICNVHQRRMAADPEAVWGLLLTRSGLADRRWPSGVHAVQFDGPLAVGVPGRHGPSYDELTSVQAGAGTVLFGFGEPTGLVGQHSSYVSPQKNFGAVQRRELRAHPKLDQAERAVAPREHASNCHTRTHYLLPRG